MLCRSLALPRRVVGAWESPDRESSRSGTLSRPPPPKTLVDCQRLILQRRSLHLNWALAMGKYVPAPYPQPVTFGTHELIEGWFTQCKHDPADAAPEYGAAAHGARLGAGIQATASQEVRRELAGCQAHEVCRSVTRAVRSGDHRVLGFEQHLTIRASEQGAERLVATLARAAGERDSGPEMLEIRIGHSRQGCSTSARPALRPRPPRGSGHHVWKRSNWRRIQAKDDTTAKRCVHELPASEPDGLVALSLALKR
jgi:hypothetical protein